MQSTPAALPMPPARLASHRTLVKTGASRCGDADHGSGPISAFSGASGDRAAGGAGKAETISAGRERRPFAVANSLSLSLPDS
jgi:hypothetical protein